jgi:small subunit ribosomal protein S18
MQQPIKSFDYKDTEVLKKYLSPHGRIVARKYTGLSAKKQREVAQAIKRARFLALLPYLSS